jgi:hypothetical protein
VQKGGGELIKYPEKLAKSEPPSEYEYEYCNSVTFLFTSTSTNLTYIYHPPPYHNEFYKVFSCLLTEAFQDEYDNVTLPYTAIR